MRRHELTWRDRMKAGEPFEMLDYDFIATAMATKVKIADYNRLAADDFVGRHAALANLLGKVGTDTVVFSTLTVDLGFNIELGDQTFVNANCTFLDTYPIIVGSDVQIASNCGFYAVGHPVRAEERHYLDPKTGEPRSLTTGAPIRIGDKCWIGGHVVVLPGVTIGERTTIGAGSVVTRSMPAGVLAAGNPCRVIRDLG